MTSITLSNAKSIKRQAESMDSFMISGTGGLTVHGFTINGDSAISIRMLGLTVTIQRARVEISQYEDIVHIFDENVPNGGIYLNIRGF